MKRADQRSTVQAIDAVQRDEGESVESESGRTEWG
jgi:hypothetical protein